MTCKSWFAACVLFALVGCSRGPREEIIHVKKAPDHLAGVRALLQRYADGQGVASEVASFPEMIEEVKKNSPSDADVVEKGLNDIKKTPANSSAIAKSVLQKLPPPVK